MKIKITEFAKRQFDQKFGGTKILDWSVEDFENQINNSCDDYAAYDGYASFCKLIAIPNFTDARVGTLPITIENYQYIRSGYSERRDGELPTFSRWLELPISKPKAQWLILVLYSKEQIDKEDNCGFDADWGVVAILGQHSPVDEPIKPETMIRNAGYNTEECQEATKTKIKELIEKAKNDTNLSHDEGIKEILELQGITAGGSGVPINKERYLKSVEFWEHNITVK